MAELLRMPEVAAAATSAVLSAWPLTEGTTFGKGDSVVVVETEKAEVEVPADADGILLKILVPAGAEVEVGIPIALLGRVGEAVPDLDVLLAQLGVTRSSDASPAMAVRRDVPDSTVPENEASGEGGPQCTRSARVTPGLGDRVFASPLARRLAREAGLLMGDIEGSGPGGRVIRRDVEAAAAAAARTAGNPAGAAVSITAGPATTATPSVVPQPSPVATAAVPGSSYEDIPHSRMRRAIADRLIASKQNAPHFYLRATCRVDPLLALREQINASTPRKVSVNDLLIKAIAQAHVLVPEMNAIWTADAVRRFSDVDVAVAIATDKGLVTPVLRDVGAKSVSAVATEVRAFAEKAKNGGLRPADLDGGSITITNLGMFGVEEFSAIINPPQAAILAVGAAREEPVVVEGRVEVARVLRLVLSVDHRPIDGVLAARWMSALTRVLENPIRILL